jgi:Mo-dependent nitrogenase C-terminus
MNSYLLDTPDLATIMGPNLSELPHRSSWNDAPSLPKFDIFKPLRHWLDNLDVSSPKLAHKLCQAIPAQCPFERDLKLFGHTILHIPPLCKLNPVYEEVVTLRFRAMCYLADECGEDISQYC